jgi:glycosyltransferase involved in cell wall biosynthesis
MRADEILKKTRFPSVSIIIPTKNNASTIAQCLDSILSLHYPKDRLEVYVIDAYSEDGTQEILQKYSKNTTIPFHIIEADLNPPQSYDLVLDRIRSEVIGFLDGDATVDKNWLKALLPHLEQPGIGGAGGIVLTLNPEREFARCVGYELQYRFERMPHHCTRLPTVNLIVKREVYPKTRFDGRLYTGYDADLCYSLIKRDLKIVYVQEAKVYHFHRDTPLKFFKQQFNYGLNAIRLYYKHPSFLFRDTKTEKHMFAQPMVYIFALLCFILGTLWFPFTLLGFLTTLSMLAFYTISAIRLARRFNDLSSIPCLLLVFAVRVTAWVLGGVYGVVKTLPLLMFKPKRNQSEKTLIK